MLILLVCFAAAFLVARVAAKWFGRRRRPAARSAHSTEESRQVRRARERKERS
ncbi:hypothetical protein [Ramlibacter sp.]|uniref:hypothetical protein n=1 Tax=Ramlibacter sp. TaxID=1917967 RepID=UPI002D800C32|nr:hypothetical protein [Ramlibacter sp.]